MAQLEKELANIQKGNRRALSKLLSAVDDLSEADSSLLINSIYQLKTRPKFVGLIGTPGAGKSTFLNQLADYRKDKEADKKIGLLLIDPSHPVHGGALLGDRIRLTDHFLDEQLFIRSISNRGSSDGLHPRLAHYLMILAHFPFAFVIIESVGGGQANTNLSLYVDQLILIFDPHSGDGIQHLKGGALDVATDLIISKADLVNPDLITQSLRDWANEKLNIFSADLTKKNILDNFFSSIFSANTNTSSEKILRVILSQESERKFKILFQQFADIYYQKNQISDGNPQDFNNKFSQFLKKNY